MCCRALATGFFSLSNKYWLNFKLADGSKTLEVRGTPAAAGGTWLSARGRIQAWARIGHVRLDTFGDFASEVGRHCIHTNDLPYERTWLWPITDFRVFAEPVAHSREPGPVTWRRFAAPRPNRLVNVSLSPRNSRYLHMQRGGGENESKRANGSELNDRGSCPLCSAESLTRELGIRGGQDLTSALTRLKDQSAVDFTLALERSDRLGNAAIWNDFQARVARTKRLVTLAAAWQIVDAAAPPAAADHRD
ncbi:unnamed protein product [Symbiodinium pilosum]|uniref:Uncharacterized protein n=1 Tax=Symbiodinium pilosum TaxID=2952 RepID=A0A812K0F0_SYMPI|nr:unnamed protein product [Symbiodinium pilosum]